MMTKSKALFSLALLLVLVAVVSARVSTNAAGTVERRVNMPYMGTGPADVVRFEPTIFWFGKVTPTVNNVDVRLWYYDEYMKIVAHVVDRRLWYDTTPSTPDLESWDAVTLYLNRDEKAVTTPTAKSNRLVAQLRHWQNGANYQAAYVGDGTNWVQTPLAFTAQSRGVVCLVLIQAATPKDGPLNSSSPLIAWVCRHGHQRVKSGGWRWRYMIAIPLMETRRLTIRFGRK
jgi:hypothetical protein